MPQTPSTIAPPKYRPDIDGLRAIAVCAVLAFHARLPVLTGGFAGVDIFFVISGFLITSLLLNEWERSGAFSLLDFWTRRVRRLAPSLFVVIAAVLLAGVLVLHRISGETGSLVRAALWTLFVNANHFFLLQSGNYFGLSTETNPLLHMWSLAVEEQFYLLWPLGLALLLRFGGPRRAVRFALLLGGVSLALSCYWTATDSSLAFYLMPSRAWELMAGALLALLGTTRQVSLSAPAASASAWGGALLLGIGLATLAQKSLFPGPAAMLPVIGTVLLIFAGSGKAEPAVSRFIGARPMRYLGKISYPLYLWHWPLLVVTRSARLYEDSLPKDLLALAAAFVLAIATYELVERRVWAALRGVRRRRTLAYGMCGNLLLACAAILIGAWVRFGWDYSPREAALYASRKDMPPLNCMFPDAFPGSADLDRCYPPGGNPTVLLWGDSHANHWRPAVENAAKAAGIRAATLAMNACRPLPGPVGRDECIAFNKEVLANIPRWRKERGLVGLIVSARWPDGTGTVSTSLMERNGQNSGEFFDRRSHSQAEALRHLEEELDALFSMAASNELRILFVLPSPIQKFEAAHCLSIARPDDCKVTQRELDAYMGPATRVIRQVASHYENVRLLDPTEFMCRQGSCPVVLDGVIAYTDQGHISRSYSTLQADRFREGLNWLADSPAAARLAQ